ncbi:hypothetical protein [Bdellovibrio sp. HCB337]|uniref:hypothetical protein n=1 Tax=Bdellovibrio sp. HCB337 TaxID=3394358 RepID=UPI0039A5E1E4
MKLLFALGLVTGLVLTAKVGITKPAETHKNSLLLRSECAQGDRGEAAYNWDAVQSRWVFVGYRCQEPDQ